MKSLGDSGFEAGLKYIKTMGINSHAMTLLLRGRKDKVKMILLPNVEPEDLPAMLKKIAEDEGAREMVFLTEAHIAQVEGIEDFLMKPSQNPSAVDAFVAIWIRPEKVLFRAATLKETENGGVEVTNDSGWTEEFGGQYKAIGEAIRELMEGGG